MRPTKKKPFRNTPKNSTVQKQKTVSIFVWQTRQHQTNKQQEKKCHKFCLFHREEHKREAGDRDRKTKVRKSHLDSSDLIMEIESIIFYTCYEINIVAFCSSILLGDSSTRVWVETEQVECYKISKADYM